MTVQANNCQTMPSQVSPRTANRSDMPPAMTGDHRQREPEERDDGDDGANDVTGNGHPAPAPARHHGRPCSNSRTRQHDEQEWRRAASGVDAVARPAPAAAVPVRPGGGRRPRWSCRRPGAAHCAGLASWPDLAVCSTAIRRDTEPAPAAG